MHLVGRRRSPRALIVGFDPFKSKEIGQLFPTSKAIPDIASLSALRQAEFDCAILNKVSALALEPHLFILSVGSDFFGQRSGPSGQFVYLEVRVTEESVATEFIIPEELPAEIRRLVLGQLAPAAQKRPGNKIVAARTLPARQEDKLKPLLLTAENKILAATFRRSGESADCWAFPNDVEDILPWIEIAVNEWHKKDPQRFPFSSSWKRDPQWRSIRENRILVKLESLEAARASAQADFELQERKLRDALDKETERASENERLLLTAQGEPLVGAVKATLETFGFRVLDMDSIRPKGDHLEDLRLTLDDKPEWEAIVEVRGYAKGAQISDLLRVGRFATRYAVEKGREPSAMWYVVNQFIGEDPSNRPGVLENNSPEAAAFSEAGGLLIPTASLYRMRMLTESGDLDATEARKLFFEAKGGHFEIPSAKASKRADLL